MEKISKEEINHRLNKFQEILGQSGLDGAILMQNVDMYYFSGTIQASILFIPAEGEAILGVVKNIERAKSESPLERIISINGRNRISGILEDYGY